MKQAAEQRTVADSDASRSVNHPREVQLKALELLHSVTVRTIAGAVKRVLQEIPDQGPGESQEAILPEQFSGGVTPYRSAVWDLYWLVDGESVDAIVTNPPGAEKSLPILKDIASFAAHSLKPTGVMVEMASVENLPEVLDHLKHSELHWVCELDYIFGEPPMRLPGKHRLDLLRRPLPIFGKRMFRLSDGDDLFLLLQPKSTTRKAQHLVVSHVWNRRDRGGEVCPWRPGC